MRWIDLLFLAIIIAAVIIYFFVKQGGEKPTPLRRKDISALKYLEEKGYTLCRQGTQTAIKMGIDQKTHTFHVKANFAVKKEGRRYLVFLRSSDDAERLNNPVLRNRLLLLHSLYNPSGILFVNPETDKIQEVTFHYRRRIPSAAAIILPLIMVLAFLILKLGGLL